MKKTKLTRSLLAACSIVALSAVMYGCTGDGSKNDLIATQEALDQERMDHAATQGELDTANGEVTRLTGELGTANSDLMTANGEVTRLTGELMTANGEVTRLTGELGTANSELMTANGEVTRLTGELMTANGEVMRLTQVIGGDGTEANPGLREELRLANAKIAALEAGTAPSVLDPIKKAASDAATAAGEASTAAGTAADAAEAADDNRATMQTGDADSTVDSAAARAAAELAAAAAKSAADASTAAQNAANAGDATPHKNAAETARDAAMGAQTDAETARDDAVADAAAELKIAGTVKSVGDTMIDAAASSSVVTTDGVTVDTGLQKNDLLPKQTVALTPGAVAVPPVAAMDDTPAVAYSGPTAGVAETPLTLGKLVDSADDVARLMIVTQYKGSRTVKVFASESGDNQMGTKAGYINLNDDDSNTGTLVDGSLVDLNNARLRSVGAHYFAQNAAALSADASIADTENAEAQHVYSYVSTADNPDTADVDETMLSYVVLKSESVVTEGGKTTTTYTYSDVAIHVAVDTDGDDTTPDVNVAVTAKLPEATPYDHIHFGVWAALGDAEKDGSQEIDDLGIGFVQNFSGSGLTGADMPNNGSADYTGSWVAAVQAMDEDGNGDMLLTNGDATIAADFGEGDITATLMDLATLTGSIAGNSFSGSKAVATGGGLDAAADFEGSFSGGFYGAKGAEAGGVFDFASEDNEGGAFRGAFGGKRD